MQHLPYFITAPGETDRMMVITTVMLIAIVLILGSLFFRLHTLPERMTHKSQKMQFEIVAVLGLLALFTHIHLFWVAGLLLAFVDIPDFSSPLKSMAGSLEKISGTEPEPARADPAVEARVYGPDDHGPHASKHGA
jgi:chromate transport protein ChrA